MMAPVNGKHLADAARVLLNPRLLMVYALAGGSAIKAVRQRRWRARQKDRWRKKREERERSRDGEESSDEG